MNYKTYCRDQSSWQKTGSRAVQSLETQSGELPTNLSLSLQTQTLGMQSQREETAYAPDKECIYNCIYLISTIELNI